MKKMILEITSVTVAIFIPVISPLKLNAQSATGIRSIEDKEYAVVFQAFTCHDKWGTDYDTVKNKDDFIVFCRDGWAYMKFRGVLDSLRYSFIDNTSVCFGDTPFSLTIESDSVIMHQHEEDRNGNYNDAVYLLSILNSTDLRKYHNHKKINFEFRK